MSRWSGASPSSGLKSTITSTWNALLGRERERDRTGERRNGRKAIRILKNLNFSFNMLSVWPID